MNTLYNSCRIKWSSLLLHYMWILQQCLWHKRKQLFSLSFKDCAEPLQRGCDIMKLWWSCACCDCVVFHASLRSPRGSHLPSHFSWLIFSLPSLSLSLSLFSPRAWPGLAWEEFFPKCSHPFPSCPPVVLTPCYLPAVVIVASCSGWHCHHRLRRCNPPDQYWSLHRRGSR